MLFRQPNVRDSNYLVRHNPKGSTGHLGFIFEKHLDCQLVHISNIEILLVAQVNIVDWFSGFNVEAKIFVSKNVWFLGKRAT